MPEPAIKDKRAQSDEAIRPTIGSEKVNVGERPVLNYAANMQQDPSFAAAVFNPVVFDALGKISKDVHDTRRTSRYYDTMEEGQQYRETLADAQTVALQAQQLRADNALQETKINSLQKLTQMLEQASRSKDFHMTDVYNQFRKEQEDLQKRNFDIGNAYLAEKLGEWTDNVYQSNYSRAAALDNKKEEEKRVYNNNQLAQANAYGLLNNLPGYEDPVDIVEKQTRDQIKTSNVISSPEDLKNNDINNQLIYKIAIDKAMMSGGSASTISGYILDLIGRTTMREFTSPDIRLPDGTLQKGGTTYGLPYTIEKRRANEAEQLLINSKWNAYLAKGNFAPGEKVPDDYKNMFFRKYNQELLANSDGQAWLNVDAKGNWDGTITEKRSTAMSPETLAYAKEALAKLDWGKESGEHLHAFDSYRKATQLDELEKGNFSNNPYILRGFNTALRDYKQLEEHAKFVYQHGTTEQINKARTQLQKARTYVLAPVLVMDYVRNQVNNGANKEQILQGLISRQRNLGRVLEDNKEMKSLATTDFDCLNYTDAYTGLNFNLAPTASLMAEGDEPGFFNYAWGQDMYESMGAMIKELSTNSGENIIQFSPYMNNALQDIKGLGDASNLQSRNQDGTYSLSQQGIQSLRGSIQEGMDLGYGLSSEHSTASQVVSNLHAGYELCQTVETRENNARAVAKAAPSLFLSYVGANVITDSKKKEYVDSVSMYALLHPNGGDLPQHSEWERLIAESKQAGGAFANPNENLIATLQKEGFTTNRTLSQILQHVDPSYHAAVRKLYYNMYAAAYTHRDDLKAKRFDATVVEDIVNTNFRKDGSYKYPLSLSAKTQNGTSVPVSDAEYEAMKKDSKKIVDQHGLVKSVTIEAPNGIDSSRAISIAGVPIQGFDGNKYTDIKVSTIVPPGMKVSNARAYENELGVLMSNAYTLTHLSGYNDALKSWNMNFAGNRDMDMDMQHATRLLSTMNNKDNQTVLKMVMDGQINPPIATNAEDDKFYLWVATGMTDSKPYGTADTAFRAAAMREIGLGPQDVTKVHLSPQEKRMVKALKVADMMSTNKIQAQTYLYGADIRTDRQSTWNVGQSIAVAGGTRMKINSPFGYRQDPFNKSKQEFHFGVDVNFADGIVHNQYSGTVVHAGNLSGYGQSVIIKRGNLYFLYGHMASVNVKKGDHVLAGQALGPEGSSGHSTGKHCHYGVSRSMNFDTAHKADAVNPASVYSPSSVPNNNLPSTGNPRKDLFLHTKTSLKQAGYTVTDQDLNFLIGVKNSFDATDAALCGRSFGPVSKSINNLDPANDQHKLRVPAMLFSQLNYKVFHDKEKAAVAMVPGVKFRYKLATGTLMAPQMDYRDIIKAQRNGNLRRWGKGEFVPVDAKKYASLAQAYRKAAR